MTISDISDLDFNVEEIKLNTPKYWCSERLKVVAGVPRPRNNVPPHALALLCGSYRWVYVHQEEEGILFSRKDRAVSDTTLTIKISKRIAGLATAGIEPLPVDIRGSFSYGDYDCTFRKFIQSGRETGCFLIKRLQASQDCDQDFQLGDGNSVYVLDNILDDNGNPLIILSCELTNSEVESSESFIFVAKKETAGKWAGLTDSEKKRLGVGLMEEEVKDMAGTNPGVPSAKRKAGDEGGKGKAKRKH